jgi:hypothetical protein
MCETDVQQEALWTLQQQLQEREFLWVWNV